MCGKDNENESLDKTSTEKKQGYGNDKQILWQSSNGDQVFRHNNSIIVELAPGRSTLSTSWLNGGYREDLRYIYNHQVLHENGDSHEADSLEGGSVDAYAAIIAERLGLEPSYSTGLMTAANMENVAISTHSFRKLEVTAIVTGGIDINGGRAGDPASYYEEDGQFKMMPGTINIILLIGANVPQYAMLNAIVTATEAKTVAIQELMAPSQYSEGIATGSGTDMIVVVADNTSTNYLTDTGKHSKLGELIGKCVIEATQKALAQQTDLTPLSQCDMLVRLKRFDVDENKYLEVASILEGEKDELEFISQLRDMAKKPALVSATSSILHIVDEISWGMIPEKPGIMAAFAAMKGIPEALSLDKDPPFSRLLNENDPIIDNWIRVTAWIAKNGMYDAGE